MSKREPKPLGPGTSVLRRLLDNWKGKMSPALAKHVLTLGVSEADQERMADLAERYQDGLLSREEHDELMEYVTAGHILSRLHSQAHMALKAGQKAKA